MKAVLSRLIGKNQKGDPINIHVTVFWATIVFWALAFGAFAITRALN